MEVELAIRVLNTLWDLEMARRDNLPLSERLEAAKQFRLAVQAWVEAGGPT